MRRASTLLLPPGVVSRLLQSKLRALEIQNDTTDIRTNADASTYILSAIRIANQSVPSNDEDQVLYHNAIMEYYEGVEAIYPYWRRFTYDLRFYGYRTFMFVKEGNWYSDYDGPFGMISFSDNQYRCCGEFIPWRIDAERGVIPEPRQMADFEEEMYALGGNSSTQDGRPLEGEPEFGLLDLSQDGQYHALSVDSYEKYPLWV